MRYCVNGDTLLITDKGLVPIGKLSQTENINAKILSWDKKTNSTSKWFDSGEHPTLKITTHKGYSLQGSYNHPVLTLSPNEYGKPIFLWKRLDKLNINDFVVLDRSSESLWPSEEITLVNFYPKLRNPRTSIRKLPLTLNKELAFIPGALLSEGSIGKNKIEFCNSDESFIS